MLILTRKVGEKIHIGDDIIVKVTDVNSHGQVKLGIEAPKTKAVHREEIYKRIKKNQAS